MTAIKLWYDPSSLRPIRRIVSNATRSYTETYDEYVVGTDISDEAFEVSRKK